MKHLIGNCIELRVATNYEEINYSFVKLKFQFQRIINSIFYYWPILPILTVIVNVSKWGWNYRYICWRKYSLSIRTLLDTAHANSKSSCHKHLQPASKLYQKKKKGEGKKNGTTSRFSSRVHGRLGERSENRAGVRLLPHVYRVLGRITSSRNVLA